MSILVRERREAAELDIAFAHREMAKAMSRYAQGWPLSGGQITHFDHDVHLVTGTRSQLMDIEMWAQQLLAADENVKDNVL